MVRARFRRRVQRPGSGAAGDRANLEIDGVEPQSIPVLETTIDDLRATSLSPEEGFILSRINGVSDIASIMKISPLSELDSLLVFWKLASAGHVRLKQAD